LMALPTTRAVDQAIGAKNASRLLQTLSSEERSTMLLSVAAALRSNKSAILAANQKDLDAALKTKLSSSLLQRLKITDAKIETLAVGFEQIAQTSEPLGKVLRKTEMADGLMLTQITVPIGVLLIVFESRPDSLPQICALSLRSGNGLLLKGGKEAEHSNAFLHKVIVDAVFESTGGRVSRDIIGLVTSREEVSELLKLDEHVDLIIPRGGKALVEHVKRNTRIPVLGHADGICHIYIDKNADMKKVEIVH
jgi:delta-1-pyrroline-5-carboxylate synthetase